MLVHTLILPITNYIFYIFLCTHQGEFKFIFLVNYYHYMLSKRLYMLQSLTYITFANMNFKFTATKENVFNKTKHRVSHDTILSHK